MQGLDGMRLSGCDGDWIVPEVEGKEFARALWKVDGARDGGKRGRAGTMGVG